MTPRWVPVVILSVGTLLGLAIAGLPLRRDDAPLAVQAGSSTTVGPTTTAAPTTTSPPATRGPAQVKVTAVNASGVRGTAGRMSTRLRSLGYDVLPASADRAAQAASVVMYRAGNEAEARALASGLGLEPAAVVAIDPAVQAKAPETDLAVLVGDDLAPRLQ